MRNEGNEGKIEGKIKGTNFHLPGIAGKPAADLGASKCGKMSVKLWEEVGKGAAGEHRKGRSEPWEV